MSKTKFKMEFKALLNKPLKIPFALPPLPPHLAHLTKKYKANMQTIGSHYCVREINSHWMESIVKFTGNDKFKQTYFTKTNETRKESHNWNLKALYFQRIMHFMIVIWKPFAITNLLRENLPELAQEIYILMLTSLDFHLSEAFTFWTHFTRLFPISWVI